MKNKEDDSMQQIAKIRRLALKEIVDLLVTRLDRARFTFKKKGLFIKEADPFPVSLIEIFFPVAPFDKCVHDTEISVDVEEMQASLEKLKGTFVTISANKRYIQLHTEFDGIKEIFTIINYVEEDQCKERYKLRKLRFTAKVKIRASVLKHIVKCAYITGGPFKITINNTLRVSTNIPNELIWAYDAEILDVAEMKEPSSSTFNLSFMVDFVKQIKDSILVQLEIGNDIPIKISFSMYHGGTAVFILAGKKE